MGVIVDILLISFIDILIYYTFNSNFSCIKFLFSRLMQKFEVVFPLDNENFLIPSKLPEKGMELAKRVKSHGIDSSECLKRYYQFSYIPVGFWGRLISRLMFFESPMHREENKVVLTERSYSLFKC